MPANAYKLAAMQRNKSMDLKGVGSAMKKKPKKSRQKRTKRPGHPSYIIDIDTTGLNKGGIVKKYKGGLMVKPKAAKRGY